MPPQPATRALPEAAAPGPPEALPYAIRRGMSRPREAALRRAPLRGGGVVAPCWRPGTRRGRGVASSHGPCITSTTIAVCLIVSSACL